jgi:HSP20 family protein
MALLSFRDVDPIDSLLNLQRELDQFLRSPSWFDFGPPVAGVFPPINVFTDGDGLVVRAEVPGIKPENLNVTAERQTLTISGERERSGPEAGNGSYHRRERRFGKFARSVQLPVELDTSQATAECRNGVLTVRIPKRAEAKPRQVQVKVATA